MVYGPFTCYSLLDLIGNPIDWGTNRGVLVVIKKGYSCQLEFLTRGDRGSVPFYNGMLLSSITRFT